MEESDTVHPNPLASLLWAVGLILAMIAPILVIDATTNTSGSITEALPASRL